MKLKLWKISIGAALPIIATATSLAFIMAKPISNDANDSTVLTDLGPSLKMEVEPESGGGYGYYGDHRFETIRGIGSLWTPIYNQLLPYIYGYAI